MNSVNTGSVGQNVPRAEGVSKVTGEARYIDDLSFPGMLYGRTLRSSIACGQLLAIERERRFDWSDVTFLDYRDIPPSGTNVVTMIADDQPYLAEARVNHREEPIALLAHADPKRIEQALSFVRIAYQMEAPVLDFEHAETVLKEIHITKGDVAQALAQAPIIVEGTYRTPAQEHVYIEPNGVIAVPEIDGDPIGMTIYGSLQCPYYTLRAVARLLGLPERKVRVIQTTTGGGFGGKEEYPSMIAGHAALLARKTGRPVKMIYDRNEDMVATTKRHPALIRHRTGIDHDGRLIAMDIDVQLDGGAYLTLSPVVLSRACIHATGPYRVPHVHIRGRVMKTNTPPTGAFRGFGAPQSQFAAEVHMDRIAVELAADPISLRRKNLLNVGDTTATGQVLRESVSAHEVFDRALARHAELRDHAEMGMDLRRRGTGIACYFHGSGFTGGGEAKLASRAGVALTAGGVKLLVGSTEIGQGTRTMHAQIVADTLGIPYSWVETSDPDTQMVPDSGPTVASRTCMIVGQILARAAQKLRAQLGEYRTPEEFRALARAQHARGALAVEEQYERPGEIVWSDETYRGDAYGAYAWGCNIADIEVDPVTWEVRCTNLVSVIDIGRAIHPVLASGQVEGGATQAVGWALYEDVRMEDGRMANATLTNYIIPTTLDTPRHVVELMENPYRHGPFGAKGVGEAPMDGPAAAIVNAIRDAMGIAIHEIPITPERLMAALDAAAAKSSG